MRITPLHINLMIHCYALSEEIPNRGAPAVEEYLQQLQNEDLIEPSGASRSGFRSTPKGAKWIEMLRSTPFPILFTEWKDPREYQNEFTRC